MPAMTRVSTAAACASAPAKMTVFARLRTSIRSRMAVNPYSALRLIALGVLFLVVLALAIPAGAVEHARHPAAHGRAKAPPPRASALTVDAINTAQFPAGGKLPQAALFRAQILLDRAHFSTGEMDAESGSSLKR